MKLWYLLAIVLLFECFFPVVQSEKAYHREFQLVLDMNLFEEGRQDGIDYYVDMWSEAAHHNTSQFTVYNDIREEFQIRDISACGSNDFIRQRVYISGDRAGLVTIGIKSSGALTREEAEEEPFVPGAQYANDANQVIEYDIHTCEADYAANTRISTHQRVEFQTCRDIDGFFPDAVSSSNEEIYEDGGNVIFSSFWEGEYLDGRVTLDITINYDSVEDAINDVDAKGGEFSFTMISNNGDEFSVKQTDMGIEIYNYMLEEIGSEGEEYPCSDGTEVSDFFHVDSSYALSPVTYSQTSFQASSFTAEFTSVSTDSGAPPLVGSFVLFFVFFLL